MSREPFMCRSLWPYGCMFQGGGPRPEFKFYSSTASLNLSFLFCKMGVRIAPILEDKPEKMHKENQGAEPAWQTASPWGIVYK